MVRTYAYSDVIQLTEHFKSSEFRCLEARNHEYLVDDTLVQNLEKLFTVIPELFGITVSKIVVTSGYRCSAHDIEVLGTGNGPHVMGLAADICCYDENNVPISSKIVSCAAQEIGFIGIANITNEYIYTHLDMKPRATRWLGNEIYTTAYSVTDDFWTYYGLAKKTNKVPAEAVVSRGIDVSEWQGDIDFAKVKGNADFAIIRAGFGNLISQQDKKYQQNYEGFKNQKIPVGAYWYSYAISAEDARKEAQVCISLLKNKQFELPIFYDVLEDDHIPLLRAHGDIAKLINEIIPAFCEELEKAGYFTGVYANTNAYRYYLSDSVKQRYVQWVADWGGSCGYTGEKVLWQYSSQGTCPGIVGTVDKDYAYSDFFIIKDKGFNNWTDSDKQDPGTNNTVTHETEYPKPEEVRDIFQQILEQLKQINQNTKKESVTKEPTAEAVNAAKSQIANVVKKLSDTKKKTSSRKTKKTVTKTTKKKK